MNAIRNLTLAQKVVLASAALLVPVVWVASYVVLTSEQESEQNEATTTTESDQETVTTQPGTTETEVGIDETEQLNQESEENGDNEDTEQQTAASINRLDKTSYTLLSPMEINLTEEEYADLEKWGEITADVYTKDGDSAGNISSENNLEYTPGEQQTNLYLKDGKLIWGATGNVIGGDIMFFLDPGEYYVEFEVYNELEIVCYYENCTKQETENTKLLHQFKTEDFEITAS